MKDQYGDDVPGDLVVLDNSEEHNVYGLEAIDVADWYEASTHRGIILVSAKVTQTETDPSDVGIDLAAPNLEIYLIDRPLHRYSVEDGFYHA